MSLLVFYNFAALVFIAVAVSVLLAQDDLKIAQGLWMILLQATSLLFYLYVSAIFQWCMTAENRFGLTRYSAAYHDHPEIWFCFKKDLPCFLSVKGAAWLVWWECSTVKWRYYTCECRCISGHHFSPPKKELFQVRRSNNRKYVCIHRLEYVMHYCKINWRTTYDFMKTLFAVYYALKRIKEI